MGFCTKRRIHHMFLIITILQIVTTGLRQLSDFLGPLWALIVTDFFNIVFCIFGFFGGYTRRTHFVISYVVWSLLWVAWNTFVFCLYIPSLQLDNYKSSVLSIGTGGFSWWEIRAPGCDPDWTSATRFTVTNCYFDPNFVEGLQAITQIHLAAWGACTAISMLCCSFYSEQNSREKADRHESNDYTASKTLPVFLSLTRQGRNGHSTLESKRSSSRLAHRDPLRLPKEADHRGNLYDQSAIADDRLRPMTPRKVKRRSARSIQSSRFGHAAVAKVSDGLGETSRSPFLKNSPSGSGSSNRNSLRSNHSSKRSTTRNTKRKSVNSIPQFVSPVNRLMFQQQLDSDRSNDDRPGFQPRKLQQGNTNLVGPQSPVSSITVPPAQRPPSARSSYSNYHPARLPVSSIPGNGNVYNLNQTLFANPAYDSSADYNESVMSHHTNFGYYDDDEGDIHTGIPSEQLLRGQYNPPSVLVQRQPNSQAATPGLAKNFAELMSQQQQNWRKSDHFQPSSLNPGFDYPLAHSPISQESFPLWGIAQAQVPAHSPGVQSSSSGYPPLVPSANAPYANPPIPLRLHHRSSNETNSETVI